MSVDNHRQRLLKRALRCEFQIVSCSRAVDGIGPGRSSSTERLSTFCAYTRAKARLAERTRCISTHHVLAKTAAGVCSVESSGGTLNENFGKYSACIGIPSGQQEEQSVASVDARRSGNHALLQSSQSKNTGTFRIRNRSRGEKENPRMQYPASGARNWLRGALCNFINAATRSDTYSESQSLLFTNAIRNAIHDLRFFSPSETYMDHGEGCVEWYRALKNALFYCSFDCVHCVPNASRAANVRTNIKKSIQRCKRHRPAFFSRNTLCCATAPSSVRVKNSWYHSPSGIQSIFLNPYEPPQSSVIMECGHNKTHASDSIIKATTHLAERRQQFSALTFLAAVG